MINQNDPPLPHGFKICRCRMPDSHMEYFFILARLGENQLSRTGGYYAALRPLMPFEKLSNLE